jgi:hypothetical protein
MKNATPFVISLAALAGVVGFAAGHFLARSEFTAVPRPPSGAEVEGAVPTSRGSGPTSAAHLPKSVPLPVADFSDRAGLDAYVAGLQKSGLSEGLAKWLAVSANLQAVGLPASFRLAKEANLENEWAVAAAMSDPQGGLDLVRTLRGGLLFAGLGDNGAPSLFFQTLGLTDPALGLEFIGKMPVFEAQCVVSSLFKSWAETSPDAALAAASAITKKSVRDRALTGLFQQWGARDRHGMLEWAVAQSPQMGKLAFRAQLDFSNMQNPEEVIALAREFPTAVDANTLTNVAGQLVPRGAEGWQPIADFPPGPLRDGMISWFANRFSDANPEAAWALAKSLPPEDRAKFLNWTAIRTLAKVAPAEIAQIVRDGNYSDISGIRDVISVWSKKEPQAAFTWAAANLAGTHLTDSLGAALFGWANTDPAAAAAAMNNLTPGLRAKLLPDLLSAWGRSTPSTAFAYIQQLSPRERGRATASLFEGWAASDPAAAGKALATQSSAGMESAYDEVAWRLTEKDPAAAMDWAAQVADPKMAARAVGRVTESWAEKDAAAVSDRLATLPAGKFRDQAVSGFVESVRELDPPTAASWAASIQAPDVQRNKLQAVLKFWKTQDPAAARAFAGQLPASELKDAMVRLVNQ